jgi:hypothetical protein
VLLKVAPDAELGFQLLIHDAHDEGVERPPPHLEARQGGFPLSGASSRRMSSPTSALLARPSRLSAAALTSVTHSGLKQDTRSIEPGSSRAAEVLAIVVDRAPGGGGA